MLPYGITRPQWVKTQQNLCIVYGMHHMHTHSVYIITDRKTHYRDVIMSTISSQITSLTIVYSLVYSGADQRKHQSSASLAFVRGIHRWPVNSPHKGPVTRKMFPFDDVIMCQTIFSVVTWFSRQWPWKIPNFLNHCPTILQWLVEIVR